MARHPLAVDDLWALPRVGRPVPSPDGSRVVVPVTTHDMEANEGTTRLWLVPADARHAGSGARGDPARPLTTAEASSGAPAWSPDGARIAFLRKPGAREEKGKKKPGPEHADVPQLWILPLEGGEPERVTDLPLGAADPRWFPDGRRIAFLSPLFADAPTIEKTAERKKEREEEPVKAHVTENRFWDRWLTDDRFYHIFVLDLPTRRLCDLTPGSWRFLGLMEPSEQFAIAPDGREIAFSAIRAEPPYDPLTEAVSTLRVPARIREGARAPRITERTKKHPANAFGAGRTAPGGWRGGGSSRPVHRSGNRPRSSRWGSTGRASRA